MDKKKERINSYVDGLLSLRKSEATVKDVWKLFISSVGDGKIGVRASATALHLFLAFFPLIIVFLTLTPFIPIDNFQDRLFGIITSVFSDDIATYLQQTIDDIVNIPHGGLMSFGFLGAILFTTNGIAMMLMAFETSSHIIQRRSWIQHRIAALRMLAIFVLLLSITIGTLVLTERISNNMTDCGFLPDASCIYIFKTIRWIISTAVVLTVYSSLYHTAAHKKEWHFISQGSIFATVGTFLLTWLLKSYLAQFNQYNLLYGSIGTLIFMIMWIYFTSFVILFGYEINMSISRAKQEKQAPYWAI